MMYIQITSVCNMECAHCAYSCGPEGEDMTLETFKRTLEVGKEIGHICVYIGGGEPTVHPRLWEILDIARAFALDNKLRMPWLATNGKRTEDAYRLLEMAEKGEVRVQLSQDAYHEPIDCELVRAFRRSVQASIRWHDRSRITQHGRAKTWGMSPACINPCPHVTPDGTIYSCGCREWTWGTVEDFQVPEYGKCCWRKEALPGRRCAYMMMDSILEEAESWRG